MRYSDAVNGNKSGKETCWFPKTKRIKLYLIKTLIQIYMDTFNGSQQSQLFIIRYSDAVNRNKSGKETCWFPKTRRIKLYLIKTLIQIYVDTFNGNQQSQLFIMWYSNVVDGRNSRLRLTDVYVFALLKKSRDSGGRLFVQNLSYVQ